MILRINREDSGPSPTTRVRAGRGGRRRRGGACTLPLVFALLLAGTAGSAPAEDDPNVWFVTPSYGRYIYGDVELEVDTYVPPGRQLLAIELFVDGRSVGTLTRPPYKVSVNVGYENEAHRLRAVARFAGGGQVEATVKTDVLRVDDDIKVNLQQLFATVTRNGRRVAGLRRSDFRVSDEGARQELVTFEGGDVPLTAVLLLDSSDSMRGSRLAAALDGAAVFVDGMSELDEASVMLFSDRLLRSTPFTSEAEELRAALSGVKPSGGTSLNDHLYLAIQKLEDRQGRRVIVLFSDGADFLSVLPMEEVLPAARTSPALIYWIFLKGAAEDEVPSFSSSWRDADGNEEEFRALRRAIEESGGQVHVLDSFDQVAQAFGAIIEELRDQYVLGYYPTERHGNGDWHKVRVRVRGDDLTVRTRGGYFDW